MLAKKFHQRHRRLDLHTFLLRSIDAAQGEAVFVCGIIGEGHLSHSIYGCFKHSHRGGRVQRRNAEAVPLVATRCFGLERTPLAVGAAQSCVPCCAVFILADKHTIVIRQTLIDQATVHTVTEHHRGNASPAKVRHNPGVVAGSRRKRELRALLLHLLMGDRNVPRHLLAEHPHGFHKTTLLHMDEIVQGRLASDPTAFPVPDTGLTVNFEAVVTAQLELAAGAALDQICGTIPPQEFNGRHLFGGGDLFLTDAGHQSMVASSRPILSTRSQGKSSRPKCPPTAVRAYIGCCSWRVSIMPAGVRSNTWRTAAARQSSSQ